MRYVYEVTQNTDLTEGKGRQERRGVFENEYAALDFIRENLGRNMGGGTSAQILRVPVYESLRERDEASEFSVTQVWGYRKNWLGQWDEGWVDMRDAPTHDPDWPLYVRLREKFDGAVPGDDLPPPGSPGGGMANLMRSPAPVVTDHPKLRRTETEKD